jgi:DNA end-binding protein Ku
MPARAIWKGVLKLAPENIPVKLYAAVEDRSLHFRVLEKSTLAPIRQQMVNPKTDEEIPKEQIRKGYKVERGVYVLLNDEELGNSQPEESRDIEVTRFVPASGVDQQWYDRAYFLGPDEGSSTPYFALAEALENKKREGIARWVMRKKRYVGALRSQDGYLMLITMRYAEEVLSAEDLPRPGGRAPGAKELRMAEILISTLQDEFRPEDFHDEYRERVMKFIEAKASGKKPKLRTVVRKKEPESLEANLAASIDRAKRHKEKAVA